MDSSVWFFGTIARTAGFTILFQNRLANFRKRSLFRKPRKNRAAALRVVIHNIVPDESALGRDFASWWHRHPIRYRKTQHDAARKSVIIITVITFVAKSEMDVTPLRRERRAGNNTQTDGGGVRGESYRRAGHRVPVKLLFLIRPGDDQTPSRSYEMRIINVIYAE